jgi:hypothetical protein
MNLPPTWSRVLGLVVVLDLLVRGAALPGPTLARGQSASPESTSAPIPLREPAGQELLFHSDARADYGFLSQDFETQANLSYCGVATLVMVLNSLGVPAPPMPNHPGYRFWTQDNLFGGPGGERFLRAERVRREGMTLAQLHGWLIDHALEVRRYQGNQLSLEQFRLLLRQGLSDPRDRLVINYDRRRIGQKGGGHISPIAAYDSRRDLVLILDVARYRYPSVWVNSEALWRATQDIDPSSGQSRGVLTIRWVPETSQTLLNPSSQPLVPAIGPTSGNRDSSR